MCFIIISVIFSILTLADCYCKHKNQIKMISQKLFQKLIFSSSKFLINHGNKIYFCSLQNRNNLFVITTGTNRSQPIPCDNLRNFKYQPKHLFKQRRLFSTTHRNEINVKVLDQNKKSLADTIKNKKEHLRERKDILVQGLRDKKAKVQEKVKEMEEIVERENIFTIPNLLCVGRGILAPFVGYVIVLENYHLAIGLLAIAGVTDLLDGFIARNWVSQASKLGTFLDPMADKMLVGALVISLSYCNLLPIWLCSMVILRDVFLITAGFVIRFISLPPPRTISRYFDATHVTAKLKPTFTSKVNTAVQLAAIATSLGAPIYGYIDHSMLHGLWYFTGFTTVAAALSYAFSKNTYKIIKDRKLMKKSS